MITDVERYNLTVDVWADAVAHLGDAAARGLRTDRLMGALVAAGLVRSPTSVAVSPSSDS